jgi:hypothetical protein
MGEYEAEERMKTFEELYCEANKCAPADFPRRLFWKCLYRHALPIAPLIMILNPKYFEPDRQLISDVCRADKMNQVWEEVRQYFVDSRHRDWMRRKGNVRISARRLINLARDYLPASGAPPPPYPPSRT